MMQANDDDDNNTRNSNNNNCGNGINILTLFEKIYEFTLRNRCPHIIFLA